MRSYTVCFLIILLSCEMIVDIDVPFDGPHLTINSILNTDSTGQALIGLNRYILDDSTITFVDNADVTITEDGIDTYTLEPIGNGIYHGDFVPKPGKSYRITAITGNGMAEAETYIPLTAEIENIETQETFVNNGWDTNLAVTFTDDVNDENFYLLKVLFLYDQYNREEERVVTFSQTYYFQSDDPVIRRENENSYNEGIRFKDVFFNGKSHRASFSASSFRPLTKLPFTVVLRTVNKDYYDYYSSAALQEIASGDPLAQPVNVYDNVKNGFGIFAGFTQSIYKHEVPRPTITSVSADSARPGDEIIIYGENLQDEGERGSFVQLHAEHYLTNAQIVDASKQHVRFIVPEQAETGKIIVRVGTLLAISDTYLEIIR
jgi:hypothetical protein